MKNMRKTSKIMSLVLALAMVFTLMAGAFTDDDKIENTKAVNTVTALGIINGYTDGSFRPENTVTRAEMAKMIYVLKNGGKDDGAAYYKGVSTGLKDVEGHWAEGYIKYAYTLGIIVGGGTGLFRPDDKVTGLEAAKMLLVVAGYDANKAGLIGAQWGVKTAALASEKGLFDDYGPALDQGAPRDFAALMTYNALYAQMVTLNDGNYVDMTNNAGEEITVGGKYLGLKTHTGILMSAGSTAVDGGSADKDVVRVDGIDTTFEFETGSELIGQQVTIVYKDSDHVYDLFATEKNKVYNLSKGDITVDGTKIKFDGYKQKDNAGMLIQINGAGKAEEDADNDFSDVFGANDGGSVRLVDNDNDGVFEYAFITNETFSKVTGVSKNGITVTRMGSGEIKFEDLEAPEDLAKNDYVLFYYNEATEKYVVRKAPYVEGTVTAARSNGEYRIGDTFYKMSAVEPQSSIGLDVIAGSGAELTIGENYKVYLYGNYWIGAEGVTSTAVNSALLINQAGKEDDSFDPLQVYLLFGDNTKQTFKVDTDKTDESLMNSDGTLKGVNGQTVYGYTLNTDGTISLKELKGDSSLKLGTTSGEAAGAPSFDKDTGRVTIDGKDYFVNSDTVVFVKYEASDEASPKYSYKAVKGSDLVADAAFKAGTNLTKPAVTSFSYKTSNGISTLSMFVLDLGVGKLNVASGTYFGYMLEDEILTKEDGKFNATYTIWDGEKAITLTAKDVSSSAAKAFKGQFVKYSVKGDGTLDGRIEEAATLSTSIAAADQETLVKASVRGFDGSKWIQLAESGSANGKYFKITSETQIVYLDVEEEEGVTNGSIDVLDDDTILNAAFSLDADGNLKHLFIATNGAF